jgi:plasmid maintenance system antidote protein VapI
MILKKIRTQYTDEEIVSSFVLPVKLTDTQKEEASKQIAEHRAKRRASGSADTQLKVKLMQLKLRLENYIYSDQYDPKCTFGNFLSQYLLIVNKKHKDFADDIKIHETLLSNIIKNRREPSQFIFIRLELHSNNTIPALYWYKLIEKETEHQLKTDAALRKKESQYVTSKLQLL